MRSFLKKKKAHLLGVDWDGHSVKILALSQQQVGFQVEGYAEMPLLSSPLKEHEIKEIDEIASALRGACKRLGIISKETALAVSSHHVVTKTIEIENKENEKELLVHIHQYLKQYFPYALEDMNLDFQVLGPSANKAGFSDILVVACKKQTIETLKKLMRLVGLNLKVVDVQSYAIERAYQMMLGESLLSENTVAIVVFDTQHITLQVLVNGKTQYVREHNGGEKKRSPAEGLFEDLTKQVARALHHFYSAQEESAPLEKLYLAGGAATYPGLREHLQTALNLEVLTINPFQEMLLSSKVDKALIMAQAPTLMTCCGLALRGCQNDRQY